MTPFDIDGSTNWHRNPGIFVFSARVWLDCIFSYLKLGSPPPPTFAPKLSHMSPRNVLNR